MVDFLRPFTPELASWASNWASVFASQNAAGNYARALITASTTSVTNLPIDPTRVPAGQCAKARLEPGELADTGKAYRECKSLQDANGERNPMNKILRVAVVLVVAVIVPAVGCSSRGSDHQIIKGAFLDASPLETGRR